jgi:ELWxxDGT repeat protein
VSDGTGSGTTFVKSLEEFNSTSSYSAPTATNNLLYYTSDDDQFNSSSVLWRSDGTAAGTKPVFIHDLRVDTLTPDGDSLYFTTEFDLHSSDLWKTDGTSKGTVKIGTICRFPTKLLRVGTSIYILGSGDDASEGLWRLDAGKTTPTLVHDFTPHTSSSAPGEMISYKGALYLGGEGNSKSGFELWRVDDNGVRQFRDIYSGQLDGSPTNFTIFDDELFFTANDGVHGSELWRTDGTTAGTTRVKDLAPGDDSGAPFVMKLATGRMYLLVNDSSGDTRSLYQLTGGTDQPQILRSGLKIDLGNEDIFVETTGLTTIGSKLYFSADDNTGSNELWSSDGTSKGTSMISDYVGGPGNSSPTNLTVSGGKLFFLASPSPTVDHEAALYVSDGSAKGTTKLIDVNEPNYDEGFFNSGLEDPILRDVNGTLFFVQGDGGGFALWKSDGTKAGTVEVARGFLSIHQLTAAGSTLFFVGESPRFGRELWKTDGTHSGTKLVKDIVARTGSSDPLDLVGFNNKAFFIANDSVHGAEAWVSDGTSDGTLMLKDIAPGSATSISTNAPGDVAFRAAGGKLYFSAHSAQNQVELWRTDGTVAGTVAVKVFRGADQNDFAYIDHIHSAGRSVMFNLNHNGVTLWTSTGRAKTTKQVASLSTDPAGYVTDMNDSLGRLFFFNFLHGNTTGELWMSNGLPEGTHGLGGSAPALDDNSNVELVAAAGGVVYFRGIDGLYTSSGGIAKPVAGLGPESFPIWLTPFNGGIALAASDPDHGRELWVMPALGSISGKVFNDANGNGKRDKTEKGVAGARVFLDLNNDGKRQKKEPQAITGTSGRYDMLGVSPGVYHLRQIAPPQYTISGSAATSITVIGAAQTTQNFAERASTSMTQSLIAPVRQSSTNLFSYTRVALPLRDMTDL